jgi:hypothetical protein
MERTATQSRETKKEITKGLGRLMLEPGATVEMEEGGRGEGRGPTCPLHDRTGQDRERARSR